MPRSCEGGDVVRPVAYVEGGAKGTARPPREEGTLPLSAYDRFGQESSEATRLGPPHGATYIVGDTQAPRRSHDKGQISARDYRSGKVQLMQQAHALLWDGDRTHDFVEGFPPEPFEELCAVKEAFGEGHQPPHRLIGQPSHLIGAP